jgi:hypothetical protein
MPCPVIDRRKELKILCVFAVNSPFPGAEKAEGADKILVKIEETRG